MLKISKKISTIDENISNDKYVKKNYYGLSILKSILALSVIKSHCFNKTSTKNKLLLRITSSRRIHVPSFVIMSFYFTHKTLTCPDIKVKYRRFERLAIPYVGWPFIYFVMNNILYYLGKINYRCSLKNLIYQIIIAQSNNMPFHFWFLLDLFIINFLFLLIIMIMKFHYLLLFQLLLITSYFLQYSELNRKLFFKANQKNFIGRLFELIPFAVTGFILFEFNIINRLQNYKLNTFIFSLLLYNLVSYYRVFSDFQGIVYHGIKLNTLSLCIVFIFSLCTFENIKNKYILNIIKSFTNYTGGIFYLHQIIHDYLNDIINDIKKGTFFSLFLIYFFTYLVCFFGTLISGKTKAKFLFT